MQITGVTQRDQAESHHIVYASKTQNSNNQPLSFLVLSCVFATGSGLCLDAFTVALHGAYSDGKEWYASTKNIQPASLRFCGLCRGASTLHPRVEGGTPKRPWATDAGAASGVFVPDTLEGPSPSEEPPVRSRAPCSSARGDVGAAGRGAELRGP